MTLEELIRRFRVAALDKEDPPLFVDEDIIDWLNDSHDQACIRGRLIRDDSTVDVTRIELVDGQHTYALHDSVYEIISVRLIHADGESPTTMAVQSREWLDRNIHDWREYDQPAEWIVQDDTSIRVVGTFEAGDRIDLECYRLALCPMVNDHDTPEIHRSHHIHLIEWALHKAFSIPDTETIDPNKAAKAEAKFTAYFGMLPDSDMRRITRHDTEHHNYSVLP